MPRDRDRRVSRSHGDMRDLALMGALLGFAAGVLALVWLWGAVAALTEGHAPPAGFTRGPLVVVRLLMHLADPARAWGDRADALPSAGVIWTVLGALVIVAIALMYGAGIAWRAGGREAPRWMRRERFARFARVRDLRDLIVQRDRHPGRMVLGTFEGHLIAAGDEASVAVVGPTRSGKTSGLIVPALLEWTGTIIATTTKHDLLQAMAWRRRRGEVKVFDPTGEAPTALSGWSPVAASGTWTDARRTADRMLKSSGIDSRKEGDFFMRNGARVLTPMLLAASAQSGAGMRTVLDWLESEEQDEVLDALSQVEDARERARARSQFESVWRADPRTLSNIMTTVLGALEPYQDTRVLDLEHHDPITADWLLDPMRQNTLLVVAPAHEQERLRGLMVGLITALVDAAYVRAGARMDGRLPQGLLLAFDEVANIAPLPNLDVIASTGAGHGIKLLSGIQNLAQLRERWGDAKADTIVANHTARVFTGGMADEAGLAYVRDVAGDEEIDQVSHSSGGRMGGQTSYNTSFRPLADATRARVTRPDEALLLYGRTPPARIRLRPWWKDKHLRMRVETPDDLAA